MFSGILKRLFCRRLNVLKMNVLKLSRLTSVTCWLFLRWLVLLLVFTTVRPSTMWKSSLKWLVTTLPNSPFLTLPSSTAVLVLVLPTLPNSFLLSKLGMNCCLWCRRYLMCLFETTMILWIKKQFWRFVGRLLRVMRKNEWFQTISHSHHHHKKEFGLLTLNLIIINYSSQITSITVKIIHRDFQFIRMSKFSIWKRNIYLTIYILYYL